MDEKVIMLAAWRLREQFGADAWLHAAFRSDRLLDDDDEESAEVWRRVADAIEEMQA